MIKGCEHLQGTHNFSAFCNDVKSYDRNPICHLEKIEIVQMGKNRFEIQMIGDRFLYRMARNIAGTLSYIGCGKLQADALPQILRNKDRTQAAVTAPAHGLTLKRVFIPRVLRIDILRNLLFEKFDDFSNSRLRKMSNRR